MWRRRETGKAVRETGRPFSVGLFLLLHRSRDVRPLKRDDFPVSSAIRVRRWKDSLLSTAGTARDNLISRNGTAFLPSVQHDDPGLVAYLRVPSPSALENFQVEHRAGPAKRRDFIFGQEIRAVAGPAPFIEFVAHCVACFTPARRRINSTLFEAEPGSSPIWVIKQTLTHYFWLGSKQSYLEPAQPARQQRDPRARVVDAGRIT